MVNFPLIADFVANLAGSSGNLLVECGGGCFQGEHFQKSKEEKHGKALFARIFGK